MGREQQIELNGKTYWSIKDACSDVGISVTSVYEFRRKNHCSTEFALQEVYKIKNSPVENYKAFGKEYKSIAQAARDSGVSGDTVRSYMRDKCISLEEALILAKESTAFINKCIERGVNPYSARNFVRNYGCTNEEALECL